MGDRALSRAPGALAVALLLAGSALGADARDPASRPGLRIEPTFRIVTRQLAAGDSLLVLDDAYVRPSTIVLTVAGDTLRGAAWSPERNAVRVPPSERPRVVVARYRVAPLGLPGTMQPVLPADTARAEREGIAPRRPQAPAEQGRGRLAFQGSKTVSLEIGSAQDLTVRQSLDVTLSGEITPGVTVRGVLSDRATPLVAEGRTTELSEVDRVYLEVEGKSAGLTLGDFSLRGPEGNFSGYERRLEGMRIHARRGNATGSASAATVPGEFRSLEFLATEGKQGPYPIRSSVAYGSSRLEEAVILAGTERVWLDGEPLVRGDDSDYTIDYAAGEITFTGRRVLTKDSRVTVDFQTSDQAYRRGAYAAEVQVGGKGAEGALLRANLLAERDDPDRAYGGDLTDEERALLREVGDSLTTGLGAGVDCGSDGYGDYDYVESDTLSRPFFLYAGPDSGTCRVRFDDIGEGKGDYRDTLDATGRTFYRFAGIRRGRYQPGRSLSAPGERGLVDVAVRVPVAQGFVLEGEGAGSIADPNTLSPLHDEDRQGGALAIAARRALAPVRLGSRSLGRWSLDLETRDRDARFRPMGRIDPAWLGYDWGIDEGRFDRGDRRRRIRLRNEPGLGLGIEGVFETLSNRRDVDGRRMRGRITRTGALHAEIDAMRSSTEDRAAQQTGASAVDGTRDLFQTVAGYAHAFLEGDVRLTRMRNLRDPGDDEGYDEWRLGFARRFAADRGRVEIRRTDRWDRAREAGTSWTTSARARSWDLRALFSSPGRLLDGAYTRRDLFLPGGGRARNDLANLIWSWNLIDSRVGHELRADLSTQEEEGRLKSLRYVGAGLGRYDSLGVYTGTGDYDLVLVPSGTTTRERRLEGTWRLDLTPGGSTGGTGSAGETGYLPRLWATSRWVVYTTVSARSDGSASQFWRDLPQMLLARKDGVPLALHRIRGEASALPQDRWFRPNLRIERERSRSRAFQNTQSERLRDIVALTLRSTPREGLTVEQEAGLEREEERTRLLAGTERRGTSGWRSVRLRIAGSMVPRKDWTLRAAVARRERRRVATEDRFGVTQATPGIQWSLREGSRIDVQATRTWVSGPSLLLLGLEKPGWEARGNVGMRLRRSLDATATVSFHAPDAGRSRTDARMELRAYF